MKPVEKALIAAAWIGLLGYVMAQVVHSHLPLLGGIAVVAATLAWSLYDDWRGAA